MFKVFIDTNVWFSAFYGSENCEALIKAYLGGKIQAVISQRALMEIIKNLRTKIPRALRPFEILFTARPPELVADPKNIDQRIKDLVSPKDQKIFTSAIISKASLFVTGNTKDFSVEELEKLFDIKVVTPKEALREISLEKKEVVK